MNIRITVGATVVAMFTSAASAQSPAPQRIVVTPAIMRAMAARKAKSKTPLTARLGMIRRSSVAATSSAKTGPTSVREITASPGKR